MPPSTPRITYYIVLFQPPPDSGAAIRPLSRLLGEEEETVRQKLLTRSFEVLARYAKKSNAEGLRNQLHALGVETMIVSDQDIRGHLIISTASANKGQGGIAFRDFDDNPLYTDFKDISGVVLMEVGCADGKTAMIVDLHRRSTSITPRLDTELFDFPMMMGNPKAGLESFLHELEIRSEITVDRRFAEEKESIVRTSKDFGSRPTEIAPPPEKLDASYLKDELTAASIWSFLLYRKTQQEG